ncbi:hypothetical protein BRC97_06825 [Halobacteriales archaeon QS_6_71_20]|nr:MAG: hypothetical protein BRC97_06825 [Halobacteriales archaeon QS_6_71_20]
MRIRSPRERSGSVAKHRNRALSSNRQRIRRDHFCGVETGAIRSRVRYQNDRHGANITHEERPNITIRGIVSSRNGESGLVVQNSSDDTSIIGSAFRENAGSGVRIGSSRGPSENVTITDNRFSANRSYGLNVRLSRRVVVDNNLFHRNNEDGEATAEVVIKGVGDRTSRSIQVSENVIRCRDTSEWAVEERTTSGPAAIVHSIVESVRADAFETSHRAAVVRENITP